MLGYLALKRSKDLNPYNPFTRQFRRNFRKMCSKGQKNQVLLHFYAAVFVKKFSETESPVHIFRNFTPNLNNCPNAPVK